MPLSPVLRLHTTPNHANHLGTPATDYHSHQTAPVTANNVGPALEDPPAPHVPARSLQPKTAWNSILIDIIR